MTFSDTFGGRAAEFFAELGARPPALSTELAADGIELLNPYRRTEVLAATGMFYRKFYNDNRKRLFVLGINPGRFGGGLTGISFTDPVALRRDAGIESGIAGRREASSEFIYRVAREYGGVEAFFASVFLSSVCPLGFVRRGLNYNFYDNPALAKWLRPFIAETLRKQAAFGADARRVVLLGTGKLSAYFRQLNDELRLFDAIIPLEHPRFIMQYRRKNMDSYICRYISALQPLDEQ